MLCLYCCQLFWWRDWSQVIVVCLYCLTDSTSQQSKLRHMESALSQLVDNKMKQCLTAFTSSEHLSQTGGSMSAVSNYVIPVCNKCVCPSKWMHCMCSKGVWETWLWHVLAQIVVHVIGQWARSYLGTYILIHIYTWHINDIYMTHLWLFKNSIWV